MNNGDPNCLDISRFKRLLDKADGSGKFAPYILRLHNKEMHDDSIKYNLCFFHEVGTLTVFFSFSSD